MSEFGWKDKILGLRDGNGMPYDLIGLEGIREDFMRFVPDIANNIGYGAIPWYMLRVGAVFTVSHPVARAHGIIYIDSTAAVPANDSLLISSKNTTGQFIVAETPKLSLWFKTGTNIANTILKLGLEDDDAFGEGIYFRYDTGVGDTNWMCVCKAVGTTATDSGVAVVADTNYNLFIEVVSALETKFYINGALVATNTVAANITTNVVGASMYFETLALNNQIMHEVDRLYAWQTPDTGFWNP